MTKLVISIVSVTIMKQLLFFALAAVTYLTTLPTEEKPPTLVLYLGALYSYVLLFNSCVNFVFYFLFERFFRKELSSMLCDVPL